MSYNLKQYICYLKNETAKNATKSGGTHREPDVVVIEIVQENEVFLFIFVIKSK